MVDLTMAKNIAIIIASTRPQRLGPSIARYTSEVIDSKNFNAIDTIDLFDLNLPLYNEPGIPAHLPVTDPTPHYAHEHTRKWSSLVRQYDGFIFVSPQYNWSIPAALKNALDFLFHEWAAKPAIIVTYGSKGGGKAAVHLREILLGLRMKPVQTAVAIKTPEGLLEECLSGVRVPAAQVAAWREAGVDKDIHQAVHELLSHLQAKEK